LRNDLLDGHYDGGLRLPTEAELTEAHHVSRQTVRRALQELVAEGLVFRVPGRGTFADPDRGKYSRNFVPIEELLACGIDIEFEVLRPPTLRLDLEAAGRLRTDTDEVVAVRFRLFHQSQPFCSTSAYLPVSVGSRLFDIPELADPGVRQPGSLLSVVQSIVGGANAGAEQSITARPAPGELCSEIEVFEGEPVLRIDRLYLDNEGHLLELSVSYFNPRRYSYRSRFGP
jgi:DNA-binding GntR family transcriptional regulator